MPEEEIEELSARKKVAILMIALGQETTAEVMKYLSDPEIEMIAQSITELDVVTTEQEDEVLEEFEQLLVAGKYVSQGGIDFARGALEKALGCKVGESDPTGTFGLRWQECLAACDKAPCALIDKDMYECLTPESIELVLEHVKNGGGGGRVEGGSKPKLVPLREGAVR